MPLPCGCGSMSRRGNHRHYNYTSSSECSSLLFPGKLRMSQIIPYLSSLPILAVVYWFFLPFLPSYHQPTDLPQSTDFYRFFRIYRILIFFYRSFCYFMSIMLSQMLFSCTYGEKCMTRSWNFLYLNFQATCNVLAQWVKCRWLVVAHFLPQGNFQMLTGM